MEQLKEFFEKENQNFVINPKPERFSDSKYKNLILRVEFINY